MRNINNNLQQYPASPNSGGGMVLPASQYMVINMEKCIPNSQGQQQTVPVAGVFATLDGRRPNNNDIGTRIIYQYDPLESVHIITGLKSINPPVGAVPTPWVTTTNPCGGGMTIPKTIVAVQCPQGPGMPYAHQFYARINGQTPNQSHIGETVVAPFSGNALGGANAEFKITGILESIPGGNTSNVINFNTSNNPCPYYQQQTMAKKLYLQGCPNVNTGSAGGTVTQGNHTAIGTINGQTPTNADVGKTIEPQNSNPNQPLGWNRVRVLAVGSIQTTTLPTPGNIAYVTSQNPCNPPITGCTDPQAINFDPNANTDDGSCQYAPRPNPYPQMPMAKKGRGREVMNDIRKGRGLSDNRMSRYRSLKG